MSEFVTSAFLTMFIIVDPVGVAPIFLSLTTGMTPREKHAVAIKATALSILILAFFALAGHRFLDLMGISLPAFRIAGGLLLFWTAVEMVFEQRNKRKSKTADRAMHEEHPDDIAAFPLAVPLLAGPGAITAVMLLAERAGDSLIRFSTVFGVMLAVFALTLVTLLAAVRVDKIMSASFRTVITRLLGVILAALAVQFVADGIIEIAAKGAGS